MKYVTGCPLCGGRSKKNGRRNGKQRYCCLVCKHTFIRKKKLDVSWVDFKNFFSFILGKKNRAQLIEDEEVSRKTISGVFKQFFDYPLSLQIVNQIFPLKLSSAWVLALDGTWLRRFGVIMIYWDVTNDQAIYWEFDASESYAALDSGLRAVLRQVTAKHIPCGVISDWKGSIVGSVDRYCGTTPHQRCLTHVKRDIEHLLPRNSPIQATKELRKIGQGLLLIKTQKDKDNWLIWLNFWEVVYGSVLTEKSRPEELSMTKSKWWYTHGNIRRAYRILTKNQNHLFEFIDHPEIPRTNNFMEGINSDLKAKLRTHRGMKAIQQFHFVCWYLTFKKIKSENDLKKLWDMWKQVKMK